MIMTTQFSQIRPTKHLIDYARITQSISKTHLISGLTELYSADTLCTM